MNNTQLQTILSNSIIATILPAISAVNLPNWWLAGGAVRNTVWRSLFGEECALFIKDFDIAFFDDTGNREQELLAKSTLKTQFPEQEFDVKNQASFGRWRSGNIIFHSTENGIENWLHTATAVGVRMNKNGEWQFFTPYGLDDLFNGLIRPTPAHINNVDAEKKAVSFLEKCPCLKTRSPTS
ncbi:nucleotidyltransferase family protein [Sphaerospermopsis aphanizomenoides BCCUSP55]|uniref:nucleotidyltransferase family protein n=1 Tax=Sphaerospermopsis aphanizomenoides TaxID=459663 RepID=UPI001907305E|nr:nucleotidyltransferase family protein [Sphaerospermopsis aphanizomenoides]MBK1986407.1 nucleotidyltransferase family protein [Sphaerospermopsis aphanizomenoides BCCUSP55]